jgi:transcriptional regulator GlxA family with amidase domain
MPQVALLAADGCYISCAAGFADVLQVANVHLREQQGSAGELFDWTFVSARGGRVVTSNGMPIETARLDARPGYDAIAIPAIFYPGYKPFARFLERQVEICDWLRAEWQAGARIGANCTGTFLLAQSGLLDGRVATTTWWLDRQFRSRYPRVRLEYRSVLTEVDRLSCAGATASYMLQAVRFVDHFMGPAIASRCARTMLIDVSHTSQIPYLPLLADTPHGDLVVDRAQDWLQKNMTREVTMTDLARALAVSDRTLARRFAAAVGQTPLGYLQSVRLQAARALLEAGNMTVQSIAGQVGYKDVSSFSRLFRQTVGISPGSYRRRFHHG